MITGAHVLFYSERPENDRAFLRDVLDVRSIDIGHGWLIFAVPPSEAAVHPIDAGIRGGTHAGHAIVSDSTSTPAFSPFTKAVCAPAAARLFPSLRTASGRRGLMCCSTGGLPVVRRQPFG
jgi:hypothetical protein